MAWLLGYCSFLLEGNKAGPANKKNPEGTWPPGLVLFLKKLPFRSGLER